MSEDKQVKAKDIKETMLAELIQRVDVLEIKLARQEAALRVITEEINTGRIGSAVTLVLGKAPKT